MGFQLEKGPMIKRQEQMNKKNSVEPIIGLLIN
jgi:hypothetical protein